PFYAEKGGQIGDQGILSSEKGTFEVFDCQNPFTDVIAHLGIVKEGEIAIGDNVTASVDSHRRRKIANNHTATHLLHWGLREVLGPHVKQAGSIVEPGRLRFDFSHHKALSPEEIMRIEDLVNSKIRDNQSVHFYELPYTEAQKRKDIVQFFGEKYGSSVRVVDIDFSKELCGGTHTDSVGTIGYFRIAKEGSIAAGMRRIEAVTGSEAEHFSREEKQQLSEQVEQSDHAGKELSAEIARLRRSLLAIEVENLLSKKTHVGHYPYLAQSADLDSNALKECADLIMKREKSLILLLIGAQADKCTLLVRVSADLVNRGIKAADLLKQIAPIV